MIGNVPRIMLLEYDMERVETFRHWLSSDIRLIQAGSAERALGILSRDSRSLAGIILDHDLQGQIVTSEDFLIQAARW